MRLFCIAAAAVVSTCAATTLADFAGQPILGPLSLGSTVNGNNTGASDSNDGFTSGGIFFGVWDGGDDVWRLDWLGGDMEIVLTYGAGDDPDLFLFEPGNYDDSDEYAITGISPDVLNIPGAPAGIYYINIDSTAGSEGPYTLAVIPTPGSAVVLAAGILALGRRRR